MEERYFGPYAKRVLALSFFISPSLILFFFWVCSMTAWEPKSLVVLIYVLAVIFLPGILYYRSPLTGAYFIFREGLVEVFYLARPSVYKNEISYDDVESVIISSYYSRVKTNKGSYYFPPYFLKENLKYQLRNHEGTLELEAIKD